ncbi:SipW-dependent-type signal peptide-containing protein [Leucobacter allii]|uniref:SipW-dependent-type signal peptide-containing protein n=1 Tax=Leucobacter allii TaxID=2932247 RepID=A0ABY4FK46_9MICO|nr:SipW-dependent-type signal peptide-containing protein [Leucobacter allii]UOQ56643.1 SipW-dependent-type signal peptide-containing protein [Leucobacter allii]
MDQRISTASTDANRRVWTKARAMLAGGLVLGVGAAITLAAWTDQEWATGVFSSGSFGIQGSANGGAFTDHPDEASAATLSFAVGADELAPDDAVYASFGVQLIAGSTNEGDVTVTTDTADAIAGTSASFVYTTSATCSEAAYAAGTDENVTNFTLTAPTTPVYLCLRVTADDTLPQGADGSITWTFDAVSGDSI